MIEIYGGKDPDWKGWHNLNLYLGGPEYDKSIVGPINPETSAQLKIAINHAAKVSMKIKKAKLRKLKKLIKKQQAEIDRLKAKNKRLEAFIETDGVTKIPSILQGCISLP